MVLSGSDRNQIAIFRWRQTGLFLELVREVALIHESADCGNLTERKIGPAEEVAGVLHAEPSNVSTDGRTVMFAELACQVNRVHTGHGCQLGQTTACQEILRVEG